MASRYSGGDVTASDAFSGSGNLNANWSVIEFDGAVDNANVVEGSGYARNLQNSPYPAPWIGAGTFNNNQYAEVQINTFGYGGYDHCGGPLVRWTSGSGNEGSCYYLLVTNYTSGGLHIAYKLLRMVNGANTTLIDWTETTGWNDGDWATLEVEGSGTGTTLRIYQNGTTLVNTHTDNSGSALSSGKPGIYFNNGGAIYWFVDAWQGGSLSSGASTAGIYRALLGVG